MTGKRYFLRKNEGAKTPFLKEKGVGSILFPNIFGRGRKERVKKEIFLLQNTPISVTENNIPLL